MAAQHPIAGPAPTGVTDLRQRYGDRFQRLQALEDALKYRRARATAPCEDCAAAPVGRCDDHGRDVDLIGEYEQAACRLITELGAMTGLICPRGMPTPQPRGAGETGS